MKIILTLLFNLIVVQQITAQTKFSVFRPLNWSDFEEIYTDGSTFTIKGKLPFEGRDFLEFSITAIHNTHETLVVECEPDGSFEKTFPILGGQNLFFSHGKGYNFNIQDRDTLELYQHVRDGELQVVQKDAQPMRDMEGKIRQYNKQYGEEANHIFMKKDKDTDHKAIVEKFFNDLVQYVYEVRDSTVHHPRIDELIDDEYWRLNALLIMAQESIGYLEYSDETSQKIEKKSKQYLGEALVPQLVQPRSFTTRKRELPPTYDDKFMASANYRRYLAVLLDYHTLLTSIPPSLSYRTSSAGSLMQTIHRLVGQYGYSGLISENMVYSYIVSGAKRFDTDDVVNAFSFAKTFIQSPFLKNQLIEFETFYKTLNKGMPAPYFEFEDRDGKVVTLSDLKGKVIYLDFWGVHCGPCLAENEIAPELYTHYLEKDVVFVNVCIDVDRSKWKAQLQERRPNVIDLYADGKGRNEYIKAYNVSGIPHYYIIDQEGKIQNSLAPRPRNLKRDLENNELSRLLR